MAAATGQLDQAFAALSHPARRAMLTNLARGPLTVGELGAPFAMSQPAVSRHLKVLEEAGLITRGRDAQWRPCRLRTDPLRDVDRWLGTFRRAWEERLDRLDTYLRDQAAAPDHPRHPDDPRHPDEKESGNG